MLGASITVSEDVTKLMLDVFYVL